METQGSLSPQQENTLQGVYDLLRTSRVLLDLICAELLTQDTNRIHLQGTIRLFERYEGYLLEQFPHIKPLDVKRGGAA
jgi:hypothetical protein